MSIRPVQSSSRLGLQRMNPASHVLPSSFSYAEREGVDPYTLLRKGEGDGGESQSAERKSPSVEKKTWKMNAPKPIGVSPQVESASQNVLINPGKMDLQGDPGLAMPQASYGVGEHAANVAPVMAGRRITQRDLGGAGVPMSRNVPPGIQVLPQPDQERRTNNQVADGKKTNNLRVPGELRGHGGHWTRERLASTYNDFEPGLPLLPKSPEPVFEPSLFNPYEARNPMKNTWSFSPLKPGQTHSVVGEMGARAGLQAEERARRNASLSGGQASQGGSPLFDAEELEIEGVGETKKGIWDQQIVKKAFSRR